LIRRYIGKESADTIFIYDTVLGKAIWKITKGPSTHGHVISLAVGPNARYAVISHEFGEKSQKLYWVKLTKGSSEGPGIAIDPDVLEKLVATTIKSNEDSFSDLYFVARRWLNDNMCLLSWDCTTDDELHYEGVVLLTGCPRASDSPKVTMGRHTAGMSDEKWWKFDSSTLYKE
jgi:hypothetical protein